MRIHPKPETALEVVQSNHRVFVHGAAATPRKLLDALVAHAPRLRNVEMVHLHTLGPAPWAEPALRASFKVSAFFIGANIRTHFQPGQIDYLPCFLSEIPQILRSGKLPIDVALIHVSPPDAHGYCTLGTSIDVAKAAVEVARIVVAQINHRMIRAHGDGFIHVSKIDHAIEVNDPLPEEKPGPPSTIEREIARNTATLIEDGATLQMGIGSIPNAVLANLKNRKHLGIHTEMWSDGALELIQCGAVDNSLKILHPGCTVSGFVMGSQALYDFIHDNPSIIQLDTGYVNNPVNIARNPRVVAINSAVEIDLTGQVCADSIGPRMISGAGGQMDFIRGAALSTGGKPIIALTSRTKRGEKRIVPMLKEGAGVVTTRAEVHYVVTEYGIADLFGKTLGQRAKALIAISHPEDRDGLDQAWRAIYRI